MIDFISKKGFTLIELLVTMAILGILAGLVLVAVNPFEQLARSRDTSRIYSISQLGRGLLNYRASHNGSIPSSPSITWMNDLISQGDVSGTPVNPDYVNGTSCNNVSTMGQGGFCYISDSSKSIIYAQLESYLHNKNCTVGSNTRAYWIFSTSNGGACEVCGEENIDPDVSQPVICND